MGLLSERGPPSWHPAHGDIKDVCRRAADYCKNKGVDITRLATHFTMDQPGISTTLVSTASLKNMKKNLDSVYTPLSTQETETLQDVIDKFMKPLHNKDWEGVELAKYRQQLSKGVDGD